MSKSTAAVILIYICFFAACKPRIYQFKATPPTSTGQDSVRLDWQIRGKASVLFSQKRIAQLPNDSINILEFKLVAHKAGIDSFRTILVPVVSDMSIDQVVFRADSLSGDTLVAAGIKDTLNWEHFVIEKLSAASPRNLTITHAGITALLADSAWSTAWQGLPYSGNWVIKSALTTAEKKDHHLIPNRVALKVVIKSMH